MRGLRVEEITGAVQVRIRNVQLLLNTIQNLFQLQNRPIHLQAVRLFRQLFAVAGRDWRVSSNARPFCQPSLMDLGSFTS